MNGRENLYRLQHWQLAERQRYLDDLELLAARLRADVENLNREVDDAASSDTNAEMRTAYPLFVAPLLDRRAKLERTLAEIETQVAEARGAVAQAQQEVRVSEGAVAHRGFKFDDRRVRRSRRTA